MVVDSGRRVDVESPVSEREGENRLTALAQDRLCSGVSRSLAVSATDLGVMGGHHRQQRRSSALPLKGGASVEGLFLRLHFLLQLCSPLSLPLYLLDAPQASSTLGNLLRDLCGVCGCRVRQAGS